MSGDASGKESQFNLTIELLYKPVSVRVEKMKPSLIELYTRGAVKMNEISKFSQHLSQCIRDQPDDQKHLVRENNMKGESSVFPKPPCPVAVLLILLLKNSVSKALTFLELSDMMLDLFPYFRSVVCSGRSWRDKISHITCSDQYGKLFIKERVKGRKVLYIRLNPSERNVCWKLVQESLQGRKKELRASMSQPHLLKLFLCGGARLDSGSNPESTFEDHGINPAGKEHDFGSIGSKSFPKISSPSDKRNDRTLKLSEEFRTGNYLANNDPKMLERLRNITYTSDCCQSIQGYSESSNNVKPSFSSSSVDTLVNSEGSDTDGNSLLTETVNSEGSDMDGNSLLTETVNSESSDTDGNSLLIETVYSEGIDTDGNSLLTETYSLHSGNQSQQILSSPGKTSRTAQLQLETVGENSVENLETLEDIVSHVGCTVDNCNEQMSLAKSKSEENTGNSLEAGKETVYQGMKRKQNNFFVKNKRNKISPSIVVHSDIQNSVRILDKQRKSVSLENSDDFSKNSMTVKDNISKELTPLSQQCETVSRKVCLNDFQKCSERSVVSLHLKHQRSSGTSSEITPEANVHENFSNNENLPKITGAMFMASVLNGTENDKDDNIVHSEHGEFGIPVIKEVISLATTSNEAEKKIGHQCDVAEARGGSNSNNGKNEKRLPVISSVEDKAFHMWTPNELWLNESSSLNKDKQIPVMGKKVNQNVHITGKDLTCISNTSTNVKDPKMNSNDLILQNASTQPAPPISECNETATVEEAVKFVNYIPPEKNFNARNKTATVNLRPKMTVRSTESAAQTVCSSSASKSHQLTTNAVIPKVSSCIDAWQKVFPWMVYNESDQSFICKACEWGNVQFQSCVVFTMKDPADVYSVAQQLRFHRETDSHKIISKKKDLVRNCFELLYPVLKRNMLRSLDGIIEDVTLLSGGRFPGPLESPQKELYTSYMIKHVAECVEINHLKSLSKSPVFSILAVEEKGFAILRWLNHKGESEEHFFSSQICCPGEVMPILTYLQKRQVDTTKLSSYSHFPNSGICTEPEFETGSLPVRHPPLSVCLKWLQVTDFLRVFFTHVEALTRVCKFFFSKFVSFPGAYEMCKVEEPYSHGCVVNEKIVEFYFKNFNKLKNICFKIYNETGSDDALHFSRVELTDFRSVQDFVSLLPKLHRLFIMENCDHSTLSRMIKEFRSLICGKMRALEGRESDERIALYFLDIYLSHTIVSLQSQEQGVKDVLTMKMRQVTSKDLQKILSKLTKEHEGGSVQCLLSLHALRMQLSKSRDCIIVELLADLVKKPELCQAFPHLFSLCQKIAVLPFLHAKTEQHMFNLAVLEMLLNRKVKKQLISPISLILLEGPPVGNIDVNHLLDLWSKKWKLDYVKR